MEIMDYLKQIAILMKSKRVITDGEYDPPLDPKLDRD